MAGTLRTKGVDVNAYRVTDLYLGERIIFAPDEPDARRRQHDTTRAEHRLSRPSIISKVELLGQVEDVPEAVVDMVGQTITLDAQGGDGGAQGGDD